MKQDTEKTKVLFLIDKSQELENSIWLTDIQPEVFAFFPNEKNYPNENLRESYAHIGQHSSCHIEYANECQKATPEQYKDLKQELESIGYNLDILN